LAGPGQPCAGLVAIVEGQPWTQGQPESGPGEDPGWAELHERLRQWRRQWARRYRADRLVGESLAMRGVRAQVEAAVAASRASVLVVGPPGSGRQHVATTIHYAAASEVSGPLVPLACSVLGGEPMHSAIRSMAVRTRPEGEPAPGCLLFCDVDQLAIEVQAELAAVLARQSHPPRLMATARHSLLGLARRGEFRADLATLLSTIVIELPGLAERREDIPLLAQALLEDLNSRGEKQVGGFTPEALDRLAAYAWPGNVDELAQAVAEAHGRAEGVEIGPVDLPQRLHLAAEAMAHRPRKEETIVLDEFLARVERELIARALERSKHNKAKAARLLGLTRPRLYRRMVQLGLA